MLYNIPTLGCKPSSDITLPSTENARLWWAHEARRVGSDWISISETVTAIMYRLAGASS